MYSISEMKCIQIIVSIRGFTLNEIVPIGCFWAVNTCPVQYWAFYWLYWERERDYYWVDGAKHDRPNRFLLAKYIFQISDSLLFIYLYFLVNIYQSIPITRYYISLIIFKIKLRIFFINPLYAQQWKLLSPILFGVISE